MARLFPSLVSNLVLLSFLAVLACAGTARADVMWSISCTLADGGSVSGWFDDKRDSAWEITVTLNPLTIAPITPAVVNPFTFSSAPAADESWVTGPMVLGFNQFVPTPPSEYSVGEIYEQNALRFLFSPAVAVWESPGVLPVAGGYFEVSVYEYTGYPGLGSIWLAEAQTHIVSGTLTGVEPPVPLPPTVLLLGSGLLGLAGCGKLRKS